MSKIELTAIIPVAKMSGRLSNLTSVLAKCIALGIEVIIVHDEQDSETGKELAKILKSVDSELISIITKSVYSPGRARNLGIEISKGDWISFWDSDDNPSPENCLKMVHQAKSKGCEVAVGKFQKIDGNRRDVYGTSETEIGRMPGIWRFAFKKNSIQGLTFPGYRMGEDQIFLTGVTLPYKDFFTFDEIVYDYICGDVSQLTKNRDAILEVQFAINEMVLQISQSKIENRFHLIFLSKQILTILKYGNFSLRIKFIMIIFKALRVCGKNFWHVFLYEFLVSIKEQSKIRKKN